MNRKLVPACWAVVLAVSSIFASAGVVFAQAIDTTLWVANGDVYSVVRSGGTVYVGGSFTQVGPATGGGVVFDAATGALQQPIPLVTGNVFAAVPDGSGGWYIGGAFTAVRGQARSNLARIDSNGNPTSWAVVGAGNTVNALALSGGVLYVGGVFIDIGGQSRNKIAALDPNTGAVLSWNPNANGTVSALAVLGSTVYAAGAFTTIGGQARNDIAALDASSGVARGWNPNANGTVNALAVSGRTIYVAGAFTTIGGNNRNRIAAFDTSSSTAASWDPNANSSVSALAVSGNTIYAGGAFTTIGGQPRNQIAALDTAGGATSWNPSVVSGGGVSALAVKGGTVYAGGSFIKIGGQTRTNIAALDSVTGNATSWSPSTNNSVSTIALQGSMVFAGGIFTSVNATTRNHIAALDAASGSPTSWNPNADSDVFSIVVSGNTVYAGGGFSNIGGQTRNRVAALDATSGAATTWVANANGNVETIALHGSTVYVGGQFTSVGGQPRNYIAALDATSGTTSSWNPNSDSNIRTLAITGNTVIAGGFFSTIGGQTRKFLAALDSASGNATAWNPNPSALVNAVVASGDTIYVGGSFTSIAGQTRNFIAAISATSGNALPWDPNVSNGSFVRAIALDGGTVYLGGAFFTVGGQSRSDAAAIDRVTGLARPWNTVIHSGAQVISISAAGGKVYLGGHFFYISPRPQSFLAAINAAPDLQSVQPASGGNAGTETVLLSGHRLPNGASLALQRAGQPDVHGGEITVAADGSTLTSTLDLTGVAAGLWNVVVTTPDAQTATLTNGFTIEAVESPQLRLDLVGRDSIRANYSTAFDLVINNLGNVDAVDVPVWITSIPLDATLSLGFTLSYPHRDAGEPDWSLDSLSFTGSSGRYLALLIPRVPPGTVSRRINLTVPPSVASFRLRAALAPPWEAGTALRGCLTGAGVITNGACMESQLSAIDDSLESAVGIDALSGIGVWSKIAWQCEGAASLTAAQNKAHVILEYMKQSIELGTAGAGCGDVLLPRWQDALNVVTASAIDPNDKLGARRRVSIGQSLPYTVLFENLSTAGLPARHVRVVDNLDLSKLDASTIRLGAIVIGNVIVTPTDPRATNFAPADVPLRPGMSVRVRVTVDRGFGLMTWDFQSIDPATGQEPSDPFAGFLPPNQSPPGGQGSVQFTVMPLGQLADGSAIQNGAAITFDGTTNNTPPWGSTVDNTAPTSHVMLGNGPVDFRDSTRFTVRWEALNSPTDLKDFTIYVSENGAPFHSWIENTATTAAQYPVGGAFRYAFYSVARDTCGNVETAPTAGQDTMFVLATPTDAAPLRLSLEGARPNPTRGALRVWLTLPSHEPATLELIDVAGRRVLRREVGALGPGRHAVTLNTPSQRAGLYFLRLSQGGLSRNARVVVIR
jgi:hypothetical protein